MQDLTNFETVRVTTTAFYHKIGSLPCPAFNGEHVHFTSEGLNHLSYKGKSPRTRNDIMTKFKLLPIAKKLLLVTTTHQEYDEKFEAVKRKKFKKMVEEFLTVKYWGFVAILDNRRLKVVVRQVGSGQKHFYSVIPAWNTTQYRDIKLVDQARGNMKDE